MKRFHKLLAVVLTGVMALTLLVGCAAAVNEKDLLEGVKDCFRINSTDLHEVISDETNYARKAANALQDYYKTNPGQTSPSVEELISDKSDPAQLSTKVAGESKDSFWVHCAPVEQYQSQYFQKHPNAPLAEYLYYGGSAHCNLDNQYSYGFSFKVAISACVESLNGKPYALLVLRYY